MSAHVPSSLDGRFHDIQTITLRKLTSEAREILIQHGCRMCDKGCEETLVTLPEGTQRQEIWPRTLSERYRIFLPDGQELRQVFDRFQEISQLFIVHEKKQKE
ncbi:MAG: hypothetical protein JO031_15415 [Ktedonobacteraceae bacterium]|nr:hypothetical protein [Ktedonobacteraceae bacterium]